MPTKSRKAEAQHPVYIDVNEDYPIYGFTVPDQRNKANALLTQKQINFIEKAEEMRQQAQEILENAYYGMTREERVEREIKARANREFKLRRQGDKIRF